MWVTLQEPRHCRRVFRECLPYRSNLMCSSGALRGEAESAEVKSPVIRLTIQVPRTRIAMGQQILIVLVRNLGGGTFRFQVFEVVLEFLELVRGYGGPVALWQDFRYLLLQGLQPLS